MQIDLAGQVNAIRLGTSKALLPLFEAVVNSVQAIAERGSTDGFVEITIQRSGLAFGQANDDPQFAPDIVGFEIVDNGAGFTDKNFESFDTAFSSLKAEIGGKGVGRLVWLKVFNEADVRSVYSDGSAWWERHFKFQMTRRGIEEPTARRVTAPPTSPRTTVVLTGFKAAFREAAPKRADTIARRIVEHCLVLYMIGAMPRVVVRDPGMNVDDVDLGTMYRDEVAQSSAAREFTVGDQTFSIIDVLLRPSAEVQSAIHFCADRRAVEARRVSDVIAHADGAIKLNGVELRYAACVTGPYLDRVVNEQRTGFNIDDDETLALTESAVTWKQVEEGVVAAAAEYLTPLLADAKQAAVARIERFIERDEPRYRVLLEHRRDQVEAISGNLNDEKLELELHRILTEWRHSAKVGVARQLKELKAGPKTGAHFEQYERRTLAALEQVAEVVKSDLAEYVLHRRTVLDFFSEMLGQLESGKFPDEDVLHRLFFPMKATSNQVDYEQHNLWLLDERLAFHQFLASDLEFVRQLRAPVRVESKDRPDILIYNHPLYNHPLAFAEDAAEPGAVVIVEFKKPQRNDYADDDNPIDQVVDYVEQIIEGKAVRANASTVVPPRKGTPFYCHVVVSLTQKLASLATKRGFRPTPDGRGFYDFHEPYNVYIELVDYHKVLGDAVKRNKIFFAKLGLHTGARRPRD